MGRFQAVKDLWSAFCRETELAGENTPYQVWYFGHTKELADELLNLVVTGKKTATASLQRVNGLRPEIAPVANGFSVVTDFDGEPKCVLQTTDIRLVAFREVAAEFAALEGEGDLSLEYWRRVHRECYSIEARELGFEFTESDLVCCERFRLLYVK